MHIMHHVLLFQIKLHHKFYKVGKAVRFLFFIIKHPFNELVNRARNIKLPKVNLPTMNLSRFNPCNWSCFKRKERQPDQFEIQRREEDDKRTALANKFYGLNYKGLVLLN